MNLTRTHDALWSAAVCFTVVCLVLLRGDSLSIGVWYYIAVPLASFVIGAIGYPKPLFQFGNSLAVATTFIIYLSINWHASHSDGLLGLGHLFSLPGAALGVFLSTYLLDRQESPSVIFSFLAGLLGFSVGFFLNQLYVCNTDMWCGPLSLRIFFD